MRHGIVLDTSVLIKWFKREGEPLLEEADRIKRLYLEGGIAIACPVLVIYEVGNILCLKTDLTDSAIRTVMENLWNTGLDFLDPVPTLARTAAQLSRDCNVTFYDASFPALARSLGYTFITADRKLYDKLEGRNAMFLGDVEDSLV